MKVATLGSGSSGNALYAESDRGCILVDAGFSGAELSRRMDALGVEPESVDALVVTHEHRDHTRGMGVAARRWSWPLYVSPETADACSDLLRGEEDIRRYDAEGSFRTAGFRIFPFLTCHDAVAPLAVTVEEISSGQRLGLATDLGRATAAARYALSGCNFLILEANHDEVMLREGPYPWSVKQRIAGSRGHLSNRLAAELAVELLHPGLAGIVLAHLSERCNTPRRAMSRVRDELVPRGYVGELAVAAPDRPSALYDVDDLLTSLTAKTRPQLDLFERATG